MAYKTSSWKDKVDPAFGKFIKFYLEFLTISQLPGNKGYLALDDKKLRTLEMEGTEFFYRRDEKGTVPFL